ncbi:hypothetical protein [Bacillus atrophaeus]|uniref:hypothetical protein n=1 Tax=Bacillus atrophaeus TaxID=1452 RepID=UPI0030F39735
MEEINIKLSTGTEFTRDKVGTCIITIKNREQDFEITLDEDETVEVLVSDILKQQAIIEENERQQEVTVNQFRQAREEIQRLNQENGRFKKALQVYADENKYRRIPRMSQWATVEMEKQFGDFNPSFMEVDRGQTAREALEGDAE